MTNSERNKKIYACHKNGKSQEEIGKIFGLSQSAVSKIVIAERTGIPKPKQETRGAKSKLTDAEHKQLKEYLSEKPSEYGYKVWNKWSIQSLIKDKFNTKYSQNYIYKIMRRIKFSSQKPQLKDYRQDPKKVAKFKEEKAYQIKKKRSQKKEN